MWRVREANCKGWAWPSPLASKEEARVGRAVRQGGALAVLWQIEWPPSARWIPVVVGRQHQRLSLHLHRLLKTC